MRKHQSLKCGQNEVVLWPQTVINLTQGCGEDGIHQWLSHEGTWALDNADPNDQYLYAPVSMRCMGKYHLGNGNEVVWQSLSPVRFADGIVDFLVLDIWHDNDISSLYLGMEVKQGEAFQSMGCSGIGSGSHTHIEAGRGKLNITPASPLINAAGWTHFSGNNFHPGTLPNAIDPRLVYHLNETEIMNTFDMKFTYFELKDGWHKDEETHCWYFYEHNGMLKDCNRWIDGKYYHFNANGTLAVHTFIPYMEQGHQQYFYVGWDGAMVTDKILKIEHNGRINLDQSK